eukprot:7049041-Heterocapsa_arctica.AAC.1
MSSKQMYNKEMNYFEVLNPEVFDALAVYHEQGHNIPMFKGDEGIIIFKVSAGNVDDTTITF